MRRKRPSLVLALGLLVAVAACAAPATASQQPEVQPIAGILVSEPEFIHVGSETVTLQVETSIPVVCAIVYGTTQEYGHMATDSDMAGGGHQDHHPLLTGLHPKTLYYARLQGVGADGTLYWSDEYTFRTAAADTAGAARNLALDANGARVAGVSSNYGGGTDDSGFGALSAIDGDTSTQWSSYGDGDAAWIEIELAADTHVTSLGFWTRTMGSSAQIESLSVTTDQGETFGPFDLVDASQIYRFETDFVARRLRFDVVTSSGGNTGAVEIEVYGEPLN
jgi:hypothetical protein